MDKISSVITITLGTIGISLGGTALGQSVTVTPSGADSSNISTQTPVTIYCDTQTTPAATITSSASTGSASCATTLNVYYEIIPGQCSLCAVPTSSFSGAEGTAVGGGCAVVGSSTALNLSPVSTFTSATCPSTTPPAPASGTLSAPTGITATVGSSASVANVSWAASSDTNANGGAITYNVLVTPAPTVLPLPTALTALTAPISGLLPGTPYSITVQAVDQANPNGATSTAISFTPSTLTAPVVQQPSTGTTPPLPNEIVSWSASTDSANPGAVVNYMVAVSPAAGITITPASPTTATSAVISGVTIGTPYTVTVTASDPSNLSGVASAPVTFTPANPAPPPPPPTPSGIQNTLFNTYGVGIDFNSHYKHNSLNSIYYAFLQYDIQQLGAAGFKTVRMYNVPAQTYINAINAVNSYNIANPNTPIHLVYQVSLCKSDATNQQGDGSNTCIDVEKSSSGWTSVNQIISGEISKLNTVITTVTPQVFSNAVSLIIVSNEDLIVSHGFDYSQGKFPIAYCNPSNSNQPCSSKAGYQAAEKFNDADITNELQQVQTTLSGLNLPTIPPLSADLVVFNPTYADAATTTAFINVITNNNHTGPILMNIYPYQFNVGTDGQGAVNNLSQTNSLASLVNAMLNTSNPTIQGAIQSKGIMLGETGWPNNGTPTSGEYMTMNPGSVSATQNYINDVVAYANKNNIPILLFEAFDEPKKAGPSDPESHYGIYTWDNDPWINLNANGINISYAGKPGGVSPTHFDPKQFSIIAPASGVNGTVTVASSGMVIPFTGPNNAAVRLSTTGSDAITLAESCTNAQNAPSTINCLGTFTCTPKMGHNGVSVCTQGSAAFTSTTGFCSNSNGGISWDGAPVETGMLPTINLGIPNPTDAVNHCNGQTPTAGSMSVGISSGSSTGTYTVTQSSPTGSVVQSGSVSPGSSVIPGIAPGLYVSITINSCTAYSQLNAQGVWASQGTGNGCSTNWTNAGTSTNNATIWLP